MDKFLVKDTSDKKSLTATVFLIGSIVCLIKLLLSGITIYGFSIPMFSGSDFGVSIGALGAVYTLRRSKTLKGEDSNK